jgi:signal transduction histidine kinase
MAAEDQSPERSTLAAMVELVAADKRDWDAIIQRVLRVEARAFDVARVSFWELHDAPAGHGLLACEMAYHAEIGAFERGPVVPASLRSDYIEALKKAVPLRIDDVRADRRLDSVRDYLDAHRIGSQLDCAVWCDGELAGVLSLEHVGAPRPWTLYQECFAVTAAQTASAALEARARTQAQRYSRRMAFLELASRELGGSLDVDEVARRAVALIIPSLADGVRLAVFEDGKPRVVVLEYKTAEGRAALAEAMPDGAPVGIGYIARLSAANRNTILVPDVTQDAFVEAERRYSYPKLVAAFGAIGVQSMLTVPLLVGETCIGVLTLLSATRRFGLDDLERAEEFARHLSCALANARLYQCVQAAVRTREEFIALAGHELRTPLAALQLTAQELMLHGREESVTQPARRIVQQVRRLDRLSSQMLDAARIASGAPFPCSPAPTDLVALARDASNVLAPLFDRSGSTLVVEADGPVVGRWDATLLDAMLSCLLDNAVKFGGGKPIEISIRSQDGAAMLSVCDHGQGIPPDRVSCIFEPFERAVSACHYGGLGLGLFIARKIAATHGGQLTVDNRPGKGATFTARLPLEPPAAAQVPSAPS